jgi:ABC-type lipoprotein release transport system permease subunit
MLQFRPLPWEYGVRNLFRRPGRSLLTLAALTLVVLLVLTVAGFVRGLESSLAISGDPRVVLIHAPGGTEALEISSIPARTGSLLAASVSAVQKRYGNAYVSPEIFLGTRMWTAEEEAPAMGLVRGVTPAALWVRRQVQVVEGHFPRSAAEVLVGRLASAKLGRSERALAVGQTLTFEGQSWTIAGRFAAVGSALEAEVWCRAEDLQQAMKRQDYTLAALTLAPGTDFGDVDEFCKQRVDLELQATSEAEYYAALDRHLRPVRLMAWLVMGLVSAAGVFAGTNAMYGAVAGRVRELAMLQTLGYSRRAVVLSLIQESTLLASAAALLASTLALLLLQGVAVRFTMGAFTLRVDGLVLLAGGAAGLGVGVLGALPPAAAVLRLTLIEALRAI